ncbi:MAG: ATP-binding protein [Gammaproteobacteria bacterium]|nr:ATP-binding protein [Gammaproteobacteria bacterium]
MAEMKLLGMLGAVDKALHDATREKTSYSELLDTLLQAEADYRQERKTGYRIKAAKFTLRPAFEDIDFTASRSISKAQIKELYGLQWLHDARPVLLIGPTGVGKTFIAQATGLHACACGMSVLYMTLTTWLENLALARSSGTTCVTATSSPGPSSSSSMTSDCENSATEAQDLCELLEERSIDKSTLFTTHAARSLERGDRRSGHRRRHPRPPGTLRTGPEHHRRELPRSKPENLLASERMPKNRRLRLRR